MNITENGLEQVKCHASIMLTVVAAAAGGAAGNKAAAVGQIAVAITCVNVGYIGQHVAVWMGTWCRVDGYMRKNPVFVAQHPNFKTKITCLIQFHGQRRAPKKICTVHMKRFIVL